MKKRILELCKKIARDAGYHDALSRGRWGEYEIAEPVFTDGIVRFLGIPQFLLAKDGKVRWTKNTDESFAIMNELRKD